MLVGKPLFLFHWPLLHTNGWLPSEQTGILHQIYSGQFTRLCGIKPCKNMDWYFLSWDNLFCQESNWVTVLQLIFQSYNFLQINSVSFTLWSSSFLYVPGNLPAYTINISIDPQWRSEKCHFGLRSGGICRGWQSGSGLLDTVKAYTVCYQFLLNGTLCMINATAWHPS